MDNLINILDESGNIIETKKRSEIDKTKDILHTVHIIAFTSQEEIMLTIIPDRQDLKNIYVGRYGTTSATIVRQGESPEDAAKRALSNELFLEEADLIHVGNDYFVFEESSPRFLSLYYFVHPNVLYKYNEKDIEKLCPLSREDLDEKIKDKKAFSETFVRFWQKYNQKFPF
jgi:isopentenyldiphosphate isomerase